MFFIEGSQCFYEFVNWLVNPSIQRRAALFHMTPTTNATAWWMDAFWLTTEKEREQNTLLILLMSVTTRVPHTKCRWKNTATVHKTYAFFKGHFEKIPKAMYCCTYSIGPATSQEGGTWHFEEKNNNKYISYKWYDLNKQSVSGVTIDKQKSKIRIWNNFLLNNTI